MREDKAEQEGSVQWQADHVMLKRRIFLLMKSNHLSEMKINVLVLYKEGYNQACSWRAY